MNSADRTWHNQFKGYDIPYNAICEFNAYLVIVYNDTNKMQRQGIASFSVTGVRSFKFKENNVSSTIVQPLSELIPRQCVTINRSGKRGSPIDWTCD
ncbi:hypothetical protein MN033_20630 [Bacillus nitratireducens]|uniref:hypothetical protein n=1 Tax=Bacillus nitratireducens TaxID=2026193 RepID=UPI001F56E695|nr:hypothetical protein [Bacillus nitratireducens]UNP75655.1 hypothetical protein MN033_20630 [Bacillus nitratireducens]